MRSVWLVALLVAGLPAPGSGQVKIEVRADGTKVMINEPGESRLRRLANHLLPVPDGDVQRAIEESADAAALDPRLVQAVIQVESGYNPRALSNKGAMGLMQLMPQTARELAVADPWNPAENVRAGSTYLRRMLDRFGELELALAAYNAGPEAVVRHAGIPPFDETRAYVQTIYRLLTGEDGGEIPVGRKVRIERDADNRIRLTTAGFGG